MTIKVYYVVGLLTAMLSLSAFATLINGNFGSDNGWNDASATGSTNIVDGEAQLSTASAGSSPFSAVLMQGDDGFFTFTDPISLDIDINFLTFDIRFQDDGIDAGETGISIFADFLSVALYDELDFTGLSDLFFNSGDDFTQSTSWTTVTLDVSALAGHTIALSFELNDESDTRDTSAFLDNVMFSAQQVSEPASLILYSLGMLVLISVNKKRYKVFHCR